MIKTGFESTRDLFLKYQPKKDKGRITQEFQNFGYRMALELDDKTRIPLYMRLAKNNNRAILEKALGFVKDAHHAKSKARLFMWKLKQLNQENKKTSVKLNKPKLNVQPALF